MKRTVAAIFAASILGASLFLAYAYKTRGDRNGNISVTGLGSIDFESDVIMWRGSYETSDSNMARAFETLRQHKNIVESYLVERGIKPVRLPSGKSIRTKRTAVYIMKKATT